MHVLPSDGWLKDNHNLDFNILYLLSSKGTTFINPGQGYSEFIIPTSFCLFEISDSSISINIKKILR